MQTTPLEVDVVPLLYVQVVSNYNANLDCVALSNKMYTIYY